MILRNCWQIRIDLGQQDMEITLPAAKDQESVRLPCHGKEGP